LGAPASPKARLSKLLCQSSFSDAPGFSQKRAIANVEHNQFFVKNWQLVTMAQDFLMRYVAKAPVRVDYRGVRPER
jgi:hypothetical protein